MKKLALLAALVIVSSSAFGAATILSNNYDADKPIYYLKSGTVATGVDFQWALLGGPVGGALQTVSSGTGLDQGYFDVGVGVVPGLADNAQADFVLQAWKGASTFAAATESGSVKWTQATGSWNNAAQPPPPPSGPVAAIPGNILITAVVPEPSTIALGLLGAAALLIRRRK